MKQLDHLLQEKLGLPVETLSLPVARFFPKASEESFATDFPVWATTLALAAKRSPAPFNLLPDRFREKRSAQIERVAVRLSAFTISVFLLVLFLFKVAQLQVLEKERRVFQVNSEKAQEIETLKAKIEERKTLTNQLMRGHPFLSGVLKEISQSLPPNAVLDQLQYTTATQTVSLSGTIFATDKHPAEGLLGELIARWEGSPFFKEVRLVSSERDATYDQQASNFQIECALVVP